MKKRLHTIMFFCISVIIVFVSYIYGKSNLFNKVIASQLEFDESCPQLVAVCEKEDTYLYGVGYEKVILKHKGITQEFNWNYLQIRFDLPKMKVFDFDSDGKEEIAISINTRAGVGTTVYELHILEIEENGFMDQKFMLDGRSYDISTLGINYEFNKENDEMFLNIYNEERTIHSQNVTKYNLNEDNLRLCYGDYVIFNPLECGDIEMYVLIDVRNDEVGRICYFYNFKALLSYNKDGGFSFKVNDMTEG